TNRGRRLMRVLLAQDDAKVARTLAIELAKGGAVVDHSEKGNELWNLLSQNQYDVVVVDGALADVDGYQFIQEMRAKGVETPVLITARAAGPTDALRAFAVGADDFIVAPDD